MQGIVLNLGQLVYNELPNGNISSLFYWKRKRIILWKKKTHNTLEIIILGSITPTTSLSWNRKFKTLGQEINNINPRLASRPAFARMSAQLLASQITCRIVLDWNLPSSNRRSEMRWNKGWTVLLSTPETIEQHAWHRAPHLSTRYCHPKPCLDHPSTPKVYRRGQKMNQCVCWNSIRIVPHCPV